MFMGEFRHSIDAKGRLIIPSKIRNECQGSVVITRGFDGCLALYTKEGWEAYYQKLQSLPKNKKEVRMAVRFTISKASECEFDKLGRITIPALLRKIGQLEKECVVLGAGDHAEIWAQDKWDEYYDDNQDDYDEIFESLDGFDI